MRWWWKADINNNQTEARQASPCLKSLTGFEIFIETARRLSLVVSNKHDFPTELLYFGPMVQRFIAWWIRNSAYIGPIANSVSALAALLSVSVVYKTFRQARRDREEELEAKHPRFGVSKAKLYLNKPEGDKPYYSVVVSLENTGDHAAYGVAFETTVYRNVAESPVSGVGLEVTDDIEKGNRVSGVVKSHEFRNYDQPYYVFLDVSYRDRRTNKHYSQQFIRKFYLRNFAEASLESVDQSEVTVIEAIRQLHEQQRIHREQLNKVPVDN